MIAFCAGVEALLAGLRGQEGSAEGDGGDGVPVHSLSVQDEPISPPPPTVGVEELAEEIMRLAFGETERAIASTRAGNLWPWPNCMKAAQTILHRLQGEGER